MEIKRYIDYKENKNSLKKCIRESRRKTIPYSYKKFTGKDRIILEKITKF